MENTESMESQNAKIKDVEYIIPSKEKCDSFEKKLVYIIECCNRKKYTMGRLSLLTIGFPYIQVTLNYQKIENSVLKHLYEFCDGICKIMPTYQTDDYSLLQIKENIHR